MEVFNREPEFVIQRNNLVTTLDFLGKQYILSFQLLLTKLDSGSNNILHFTNDGDCCANGERTPAVWVYNDKIQIASAIRNYNYYYKNINLPLQTGKWIKFEISQTLKNNKV